MLFETNKDKGRAGMAMGIAWFGANGYTINIPLNDTQWYDFVAEKDGKFYAVQCKATGSKDNSISLRNTGGTNGGVYGRVIDTPIDFLFCLDKDQHMYVIPGEALRQAGNLNNVSLRTEKSKYANSNTLDTSQYLVSF